LSVDDLPDVIHFYSYETGVSIELPIGFEEQFEESGVVAYVDEPDDDDDDATPLARVLVQVVGEVTPDRGSSAATAAESAAAGLAKGFAGQGGEVISTRSEVIDEVPTSTTVLHRNDPTLGGEMLFHQTAAVSGGKLLSISAVAPDAHRAEFLPAFDAAIRSIRFVAL
jgi:hypothetical protein